MKIKSLLGLAAPAFAAAIATSSPASAAPLPAPSCGLTAANNCLYFDDFTVYSLALLNFQAGAGDVNGNDPYAVDTSGVKLQNAIVIATGVNGNGSINTDISPTGVDDAHETPTGNMVNFQTSSSNDGAAGSGIASNSTSTWDINVNTLNTFLAGGQLEFYFNLNQTNSATTTYLDTPQDALGWMAVTLTDANGGNLKTFYLDGDACTGPAGGKCDPTQAVSMSQYNDGGNADLLLDQTAAHDEWAYVHGAICVDPAGAVIHLGACGGGDPANAESVNQNLGASLAAFALVSDQLNFWLNSGFYDGGKMSVDLRMAGLTNGYEQMLILAGPPTNIPEPITLGLVGAGLVGVGLLRRRKKA